MTVGRMTDESITAYKRVPACSYEQSKNIFVSIKGVEKAIPHHTLNGGDWRTGIQIKTRQHVIYC